MGTEFVGTFLTTNVDNDVSGPWYGPMITYNLHIRFCDGDRRGWMRGPLMNKEFRADFEMVITVSRPEPAGCERSDQAGAVVTGWRRMVLSRAGGVRRGSLR